MKLDGRVVVITGASSGLGAALARELAARGARLGLAGRRRERLEALADELSRGAPGARHPAARPVVLPCDLSKPGDAARLVAAAWEEPGPVDVFVNNAGVSAHGAFESTRNEDFRQLVQVNLAAPVEAMQALLPRMAARGGGLIVNIASLAGLYGVPWLAAYGATKAGLAAMTQGLRAEWAARGVRFLVAYPDYMDTPLFDVETRLGGARRPPGPYPPVERTARILARAIEKERPEIVTGLRGHLLYNARGILRPLVDRVMARMAEEQRDETVPPREAPHAAA